MTYTSNPKNATSRRKKSTILASSSATVEYKWTPRSSKVLQTGPSPITQQKSVNSLGLWATTDTSSKDTQRSHARYWILPKRQSYGTGERHNTKRSKNPNYILLHSIRQPSHPPSETMTSMNESS